MCFNIVLVMGRFKQFWYRIIACPDLARRHGRLPHSDVHQSYIWSHINGSGAVNVILRLNNNTAAEALTAWPSTHLRLQSNSRHNSSLQWRHNGRDGVSNHQLHDYSLDHLIRRTSKKAPKLRVTGLGAGNSPRTGEFPAQMASNAENISIW